MESIENKFCRIAEAIIEEEKREIIEEAEKECHRRREELEYAIKVLKYILEHPESRCLYCWDIGGCYTISGVTSLMKRIKEVYNLEKLSFEIVDPRESTEESLARTWVEIEVYTTDTVETIIDRIRKKLAELEDELKNLKAADFVDKEKIKKLLLEQFALKNVCKTL